MTTEELIDSQERRIKQLEMDLAVVMDLKGTISAQLDCIEQYRSDLAERDKVARDRLKRIEHLERVVKAADLVSSMSTYDEDTDEVHPCHICYFEELENALIPWRQSAEKCDAKDT